VVSPCALSVPGRNARSLLRRLRWTEPRSPPAQRAALEHAKRPQLQDADFPIGRPVADESVRCRWWQLRGSGLSRVLPADHVAVEVVRQLLQASPGGLIALDQPGGAEEQRLD
jgi:hypothetical protein